MSRTVASWNVLYLLRYAEARGLSRRSIVEDFRLDQGALDDVDGRVPLATYVRMWNELPALASDPDMPLHVLEHAVETEPPLSALIFLSSPTLGDALRRMARYQRITLDLADEPASDLVIDGEHAHIVVYPERSEVVPPTGAVIDACLGLLTLARMGTKRDILPLELRFRHPTPRNAEQYRRSFGCPVSFDAERDRMTLRTSDLSLVQPEASRTLFAIVERYAERVLADLPTADDFMNRVRRSIRARLSDGHMELSAMAEDLGVSARTFQRRLEAEGTTLRRLVDEERRALALHHIQNARTSLVDIALLLGFADQSSFTRAFSRWTGRSPAEYRRQSR